MTDTQIEEITTKTEWNEALPVVRQLWTDADDEFLSSWFDEDDYRPFGLYRSDEGEVIAVAGVSIQRVLHHTRHAWIHDFVVDKGHRGRGYGTELLSFVESWARECDCEYVALAARRGNDAAVQFYENRDMEQWGYVIEREL